MTLDEAIEILGGYVYEEKPCPVGLFDDATKLGIEALKRFKQWRFVKSHLASERLPGETET